MPIRVEQGQDKLLGTNITYVPITGDIATYVAAATIGDTLILASGTYVLATTLNVTKALNIIGQGEAQTILSCAVANVAAVSIVTGVRLANLSIVHTGATDTVTGILASTATSIELANISINISGTANVQRGLSFWGVSGRVNHCTISVNSTSTSASEVSGIFALSKTGSTSLLNIYDSSFTAQAGNSGAGDVSNGIFISDLGTATCTINAYNSLFKAIQSAAADEAYGANIRDTVSIFNAYNCTFSGSDYDLLQAYSATLQVSNCTLLNGTTSGTITYDGTVFSEDFKIGNMSLSTSTYSTINDFFKLFTSAGRITGGAITDAGGETVNVAAGTGVIRIADDDTSQVKFFNIPATTALAVPTNTVRYIGVDYNTGTAAITVEARTTQNWDLDTEFPLGSVINQAGTLYIINDPWWVGDGLTNVIERFQSEGTVRDNYVGGLIIGTSTANTTRKPTLTSGTVWSRLSEFDIGDKDCSATDTFYAFYRDGAGGWTRTAAKTDIDDFYDDNSGTLQALGLNKYVNFWIFAEVDTANNGQIMVIYPQNQYNTAATAEAEDVPVFPSIWYKHGILLGKIVIKQGVTAPVAVESAFSTMFSAALAADHGNLSGLADDDHTQYYLVDGTRAITGNLTVGDGTDEKIEWVSGNITYVPIGGDIATYITAATAGDTLQLAAGTYTITSVLTVSKKLHIRGMGQGITSINCATADVNMIDITTTAGTVLSDLTLNYSSANTATGHYMVKATATCDLYNVTFNNTSTVAATMGSWCFWPGVAGIFNVNNCTFSMTGDAGYHPAFYCITASVVVNARNCIATETTGDHTTFGPIVYYLTNGTYNLYNCVGTSAAVAGTAGAFHAGGGAINAYNCTASGTLAGSFDVKQTAGTLTLYDTTLVNNTTSGTITYGGTVRTNNLIGGDLTSTSTSFVQAMNLVNNAKFDMIEDLNNLIDPTYIKGFWVFDQTGATTSVTDRSPNAHTLTLGGNASTLTPSVAGLCPNLLMGSAAATSWTVADHADFSFGNGAGVDSAFSVITLVKPTDATSCYLMTKFDNTTPSREWFFIIDASDYISFKVYNVNTTDRIGRYYNTALTSDEGSWHCYVATASGGSPQAVAGLKIYRDGTQVDDTNAVSGTYTGMTDGSSVLACSFNNVTPWAKATYGVSLVVSKELTAAEVKRISDRLRAYSGAFL